MPLANYLIEQNLLWEARAAVPIKLQDILRFDIVAVAYIMDKRGRFQYMMLV